jgi:hypothetical protein
MGIDRIGRSDSHISRIFLIAVFGLSTLASARAFEVTDQQRAACTPDAFRLCSSEMPDANRVAACMIAKQASLSAPCRAVFAAAHSERSVALLHRHHRVHWAYAHRHRFHSFSRYAHYHRFHSFSRYAHYREFYAPHRHAWERS